MRMTQLVLRIAEEQKQFLALEAQHQGETISHVVRRAIAHYVENKRKGGTKNELLALAQIGKRFKGKKYPTDLSANYKRYLYGDKRI